jgi:hypothetical protein
MHTRTVFSLAALTGLTALVTACSSAPAPTTSQSSASSSAVSPSSVVPSSMQSATPAPSASMATTGAAAAESGRQQALARPASGLRDGQSVVITASGFAPGRSLVAVQCADKGAATGPGDCDVERISPAVSDAKGHVSVTLKVRKGPFGGNRVVCGGTQRCLVSIADAAQPPQEQAAALIAFR